MILVRNKIILGKVNALAVVFIALTSPASSGMAQTHTPLAEGLVTESGDGISFFLWIMA